MGQVNEERGQTLAEYGVVLGVITIGIITAVAALNGALIATFQRVADLVS